MEFFLLQLETQRCVYLSIMLSINTNFQQMGPNFEGYNFAHTHVFDDVYLPFKPMGWGSQKIFGSNAHGDFTGKTVQAL